MSSVDKLLISGIRSYSPDESNHQVILFFKPMTVIIGSNGCGKTTIIECLKYMTTGDYPPGGKSGGFVHDPKLCDETSVDAVIKLKFVTVSGSKAVASRHIRSVYKAKSKNPSQSALEGSLAVYNDDTHEAAKTSSRCTDLDKRIPLMLGVSKEVLVHVVFCHQEDSNWPLSEPAALKKRFDELFASTRYNQALDAIKKIRSEQQQAIRTCDAELTHLADKKRKAQELRDTKGKREEDLEACDEEISQIDAELEPIQTELDRLTELSDRIQDLTMSVALLKSQRQDAQTRHDEHEAQLSSILKESEEELVQSLRSFDADLKAKQRERTQALAQLSKHEEKQATNTNQLSSLRTQLGGLMQEANEHARKKQQRSDLTLELAQQLNITKAIDPNTFHSELILQQKELQQRRQKIVTKCQQESKRLELEHTKLNQQRTEARLQQDAARNQAKHARERLQTIMQRLRSLPADMGDLALEEAKKAEAERLVKEAEGEIQQLQERVSIDKIREEKAALEHRKQLLDNEVAHARANVERQHKVKALQSALEALEKQRNDVFLDAKAVLESVLEREPSIEEDLLAEIQALQRKQDQCLVSLDAKKTTVMQSAATFKAQQQSTEKQLAKLSAKKQDFIQQIESVCQGRDPPSLLAQKEEELTKLKKRSQQAPAIELFYKLAKKEARKKSCCMMCERSFSSADEISTFISKADEKIASADQVKQSAMFAPLEAEIEQLKRTVRLTSEVEHVTEQMDQLKLELASLAEQLRLANSEQEQVLEQIEDVKMTLTEVQDAKHTCSKLKDFGTEMSSKQSQLKREQSFLKGTGRTVVQVEADMRSVEEQREELIVRQTEAMELKEAAQQRLADAQKQLSKSMSELSKAHQLLAERERLKQEEVTVRQQMAEAKAKTEDFRQRTEALDQQVEAASRARTEYAKHQQNQVDEADAELRKITRCLDKLQHLEDEVSRYVSAGREKELQSVQRKVSGLEDQVAKTQVAVTELESKLNSLAKFINRQSSVRNNIDGNIKLYKIKRELVRLEGEQHAKQAELQELGLTSDTSTRPQLEEDKASWSEKRAQLVGRKQQLAHEVEELERQLGDRMYRDAEFHHTEKTLERTSVQQAHEDLLKYYNALDKAIVQFHTLRMQTINQTIKEMWQKTYRGNDIDYIAIDSNASTAASDTLKKRSFNYKVVMVKGNTRLDMRGRCSAGQKVLASIIIRLALADSFCANCGVLALDEPTSFLDRDNIEALARCLSDIVRERQEKQANFQLILITHDEEFMEQLHRNGLGRTYYRVGKSDRGHSEITQQTA
eukprot:m.70481 g.70481  ORF g.70481 m.70481 type:complete len:1301 (-) comp12259_c0_seq8:731-4633(-)